MGAGWTEEKREREKNCGTVRKVFFAGMGSRFKGSWLDGLWFDGSWS
jgi:hypothetical protein